MPREARAEPHEAARRYGEQCPKLRIEFLAAVDEAMERMVRLAKYLGSPPGIDPTLGIKRVFVKRFPSILETAKLHGVDPAEYLYAAIVAADRGVALMSWVFANAREAVAADSPSA